METERLILRPWREDDAEVLFQYASDPELGPRAGWPPHQCIEESLEVIRSFFSNDHTWAIALKGGGEVVGCIGYLPQGETNIPVGEAEAEVGYWVAKPFWGRGICSEALKAVVDYCFGEKGFTALWGDYFVDNPASGRVMEKCGFADCHHETYCPNLLEGGDRPVRVMKLTCAKA